MTARAETPTERAVKSAVTRPDMAAIRKTYETVDAHPRILRSGLRLIGSDDILGVCEYVEALELAAAEVERTRHEPGSIGHEEALDALRDAMGPKQ